MTNEEAIRMLTRLKDQINFEWTDAQKKMDALNVAIKALKQTAWIPCSERLPEPRIDVWCNSDMGQMVGYYEENVETWYGRDYLELMVTAWMPLPYPYQPERKDNVDNK